MVAQSFVEEENGTLTINLMAFKSRIDFLLKRMKLEEIFHSNGTRKGWKLLNYTKRTRAYMAQGYVLIFNFRRFLLDEDINYRYYYTDNQGQAHVTTWTEHDVIKHMKFSQNAIQINPASAKNASIAKEYQTMLQEIYSTYTAMPYMHIAQNDKTASRMLASQAMRNKYGGGLFKANGKSPQAFTQGHIFEAIDGAIAEILENNGSADMIESYIFGKYLVYDNIKASRGGDTALTNTSVKANSADLYDFSTIKSQLELISSVIDGGIDYEKTLTMIEKEFLHQSKFKSQSIYEETAQRAYNKLFEAFKKDQKLQATLKF